VSALPEPQAFYSPAALAALVRDFDRDAVGNRKRISEILQFDSECFYLTAIEILKKDLDSRAAQYLISLLVSRNLLFRALCDSALVLERAVALAHQAYRTDPTVDVRLARQLSDTTAAITRNGSTGMAERLLEILDEISDGKRILPSLMRLLRTDNPYLRSKAVLMIGRSGRSLSWIKKRLEESDTRVRANAVEAMWGVEMPDARELLEWAARDNNNRVVGNALVGLYRLGEISPLAELVRLAGHNSPQFRRTAAWAMGKTGDPRFSEVLGRMIADPSGEVRKVAFAAVRRIREDGAQVLSARGWPVAATCSPKNPRTGQRCASVAVVSADGRESPRILPVQFILSEDGQPIWSYRTVQRMAPDPMTVIFLFPRKADNSSKPWDQGGLRCLNWKRSTDLWSAVPYSGDDVPSGGPADLELPSFIANAAQAARIFEETPKRRDCTGFWTAVHRALLPDNATLRGKRHVIVLAPDEVQGLADDLLISAARAARASVQVISTSANPALQEFCRRIDGHFRYVGNRAGIEEAVSLAYLSLLARYEIRYQSVNPDARNLKIRVHTPLGWGETTVDL